MAKKNVQSATRKWWAPGIAALAAAAALFAYQGPSRSSISPGAVPAGRSEKARSSATRPTRPRLPTRTEADVIVPPEAVVRCPLVVIDAEQNTLVDDPGDVLPGAITVQLTPPVLPRITVELDDEQGSFPADTAQRLQQLPFRDGTVYGEAPDVGLVSFTLQDGACTRMQVLLVAPPDPDALRCPLDDTLRLVDIRRVVYASGPRAGRAISVRPWQGTVVLEDVPASGDGWVQVIDHPPIPFAWDDDGCDTIEPIGTASVTARIQNPPPNAPTWIRGCGVSQYLPPGSDRLTFEVTAVPCALEAWRSDGALRALSTLATLDPSPGEQVEVVLSLPEEQVAGLGIQFRTGDAGVTIAGVWPESPAWQAGLRRGDRILSVDGEPVAGLQDSDFIVLGTGPVGTVAELLVENEQGDLESIEVERALLMGRLN